VSVSPPLNQLVIENMLRLPGLNADTLLQAIKGNTFDHVSAIYNLLVDRLEPTMPNLPSIQSIPGDYLPDGAHQLEKVIILIFKKRNKYLTCLFLFLNTHLICTVNYEKYTIGVLYKTFIFFMFYVKSRNIYL